MMEPAQPRTADHCSLRRGPGFDRPLIRCVLAEAAVDTILVKVRDVNAEKAPQMLVAQRDHVIEKLPAHGAHPPFGDSVLPRARTPVRLGLRPVAFKNATTSPSNFESRSMIM